MASMSGGNYRGSSYDDVIWGPWDGRWGLTVGFYFVVGFL